MLEAHARAGIRNRLLHKISLQDWDLIGPHLEAVTLKDRQVIEVPTKPITHAYFVETGIASVVAVDAEDHRIEVGVIDVDASFCSSQCRHRFLKLVDKGRIYAR